MWGGGGGGDVSRGTGCTRQAGANTSGAPSNIARQASTRRGGGEGGGRGTGQGRGFSCCGERGAWFSNKPEPIPWRHHDTLKTRSSGRESNEQTERSKSGQAAVPLDDDKEGPAMQP